MTESKYRRRLLFFPLLAWLLVSLPASVSAHLPKPLRASGVILSVDRQQKIMLFEPSGRKPLQLHWDKRTAFIQHGANTSAGELITNSPATIDYQPVSFHLPLLKRVVW